MLKKIYIISGGTFVDVSPHFSLAARAFGQVGENLCAAFALQDLIGFRVIPLFTAMAGEQWMGLSMGDAIASRQVLLEAGLARGIVTNDDLLTLVTYLKTLPDTKAIIMAAAVCDWVPNGMSDETGDGRWKHEFGRNTKRLKTRRPDGTPNFISMDLVPSKKIVGTIRAPGPECRGDIVVVGFKTTAGSTEEEQASVALRMLKENNLSLVVANDINTHVNLLITPEGRDLTETSTDRFSVLRELAKNVLATLNTLGAQ